MVGGVLAVLLLVAGCSGQAQEQPEEPKGPELTPGEKAAIEFYKAKYVDGDEKKFGSFTRKIWLCTSPVTIRLKFSP